MTTDLEQALGTERALLAAIGAPTAGTGYTAWRSERFPTFFGGNLIWIDDLAGRGLADWEAIFERHLPPDRFRHRTFVVPDTAAAAPLAAAAAEAGYIVDREVWMRADDAAGARHALPEGFERATVETDADWAQVHAFDHAQHVDEPWFDPERTDSMLAARFRHVTAALDITWWVAQRPDDARVVAKVGLFEHAGVARLQEVVTDRDHRRRGLARGMVSAALREAVQARGVPCCLCADAEDVAAGLYRSLGFRDVGRMLNLWRRPG